MPANAKAAANQAPKLKWFGQMLACGTRQQRLYINGSETPYFIHSANGVLAHRTEGQEHGLFGSGMGPIPFGQKHGLRIAAVLGAGSEVAVLKHRAEQWALADLERHAAA